MTQNSRESYFKGMDCWRHNDYINARRWFEISYNEPEFREESLYKLIQIDLREGKYAKVRKLLKENIENQTVRLKQAYGLLENIENNYESSKRYYSECMAEPKMQNRVLLSIAKLYIQTGNHQVARKMFETLQLNKYYNTQSTTGLICLNILEGNYKDAEKLLKEIDERRLTPKLYQHYQILNMYVKYFQGNLKTSDNHFDPVKEYMIYRLFDNSDETLLNHIQRHTNQRDRKSNGCFFEHTDLKKLLSDAREKIENMNSNHFEFSDMYRFRLDNPIGFKGSEITSDLCVATIIGTKDILTMYPVLLSDEFDKEGFSTSKELMIKRNYGGIKK